MDLAGGIGLRCGMGRQTRKENKRPFGYKKMLNLAKLSTGLRSEDGAKRNMNVSDFGGSLTTSTASISAVWWQRKLEGQQDNYLSKCYTTEQWEADRGNPNSRSLVRMCKARGRRSVSHPAQADSASREETQL